MEKKHVEALLFVAKEPLKLNEISKMLQEEEQIVLRWIIELQNEYKDRGILIRQVAGGFEMVSSAECHEAIEQIVPKEYERDLSNAQLETVTIVAFNQPTTRSLICKFRNVKNPDEAIQRLLDKKLIRETDKGYVTTENFLKFFGINDLKELPAALEKVSKQKEDKTEKETPSEEVNTDESVMNETDIDLDTIDI